MKFATFYRICSLKKNFATDRNEIAITTCNYKCLLKSVEDFSKSMT